MTDRARARPRQSVIGDHAMMALYLAASMGASAVLLVPADGSEGVGKTVFVASWIVLYAWGWWRWVRARGPMGPGGLVLFAFAGWALISAAWSPQPLTSAAYAVALLSNVAFVAWSARRFPPATFLWSVLMVTAILVIGGLTLHAFGIDAVRYIDVHQRTTLFGTEPTRALFNHKITAGTYAVFAILIAWYLLHGWWRLPVCAGLAIFVLATGSNGSLALALVAVAAVAFLAFARAVGASAGVVLAIVLTGASIGAASTPVAAPSALEALGRDPSLTGRFDLWAWGGRVALERPLHGWGYFGYPGSERAAADGEAIPRFANYALPHFHNAYLQMLVDLGVIGAFATVGLLAWALHVHARRGLALSNPAALATAAILIVAIAAGMGMHAFFQYNHFLTLFVMRSVVEVRLP